MVIIFFLISGQWDVNLPSEKHGRGNIRDEHVWGGRREQKSRVWKSENLFHSNKIKRDTKSFQKHFAKLRIRGKGRIALDSEKNTCSHDGCTTVVVLKMGKHKLNTIRKLLAALFFFLSLSQKAKTPINNSSQTKKPKNQQHDTNFPEKQSDPSKDQAGDYCSKSALN